MGQDPAVIDIYVILYVIRVLFIMVPPSVGVLKRDTNVENYPYSTLDPKPLKTP